MSDLKSEPDGADTIVESVLFADIVGSTRLYQELGDEPARALLVRALDAVAETVGAGGGRVRDRIGDEILATFESVQAAFGAACDLHERLERDDVEVASGRPLRLRIGLDHGPVLETEQGLFGTTVHRAARLTALAGAGQTLTTGRVYELLPKELRLCGRYHDTVVLKGLSGEQRVYELIWRMEEMTESSDSPSRSAAPGESRTAEIAYQGRTYRVGPESPRLEIGRDASADLRVQGRAVSHIHARVLWRAGAVILEDVSRNGTEVSPSGEASFKVHNGEAELSGSGTLRLGARAGGEGSELVAYRCTPLPVG